MRMVSFVPSLSGANGVDAKPQCKQLLVQDWVHRQGKINRGPVCLIDYHHTQFLQFNETIKLFLKNVFANFSRLYKQ
jgi:hypothetical protein